jgi:sulfite exporter TauE/SafE
MNDYILLFSAGLLGSLHCIGMCGGLIMACGMKFGGGPAFSISYNAGRLLSYSILGFMMGLFGKALIAAGLFGKFQGLLPIIAGILMVMIGLDLLGYAPKGLKKITAGIFPKVLSDVLVGNQLKKRHSAPLILGMLNGLIPCGLLYAIGVKAASTADPVQGVLTMTAFGSGTLPALMLAGSFSGAAGRVRSNILSRLSSVFIILLGIKSLLYGIGYLKVFVSL